MSYPSYEGFNVVWTINSCWGVTEKKRATYITQVRCQTPRSAQMLIHSERNVDTHTHTSTHTHSLTHTNTRRPKHTCTVFDPMIKRGKRSRNPMSLNLRRFICVKRRGSGGKRRRVGVVHNPICSCFGCGPSSGIHSPGPAR